MSGRSKASLEDAVREVVEEDLCSGCGACTHLDRRIKMTMSAEGYARPVFGEGPAPSPVESARAARHFNLVCPGRQMAAGAAPGSQRDALFGQSLGVWEAWATDDAARFEGSSGGTLTAVSQWLLSSGRVRAVNGVRMDGAAPTRTIPTSVTTATELLDIAGSRYAPSPTLANPAAALPDVATIAKPCEASALRALTPEGERPIILSFFCAGVPSQHATDELSGSLGVPVEAAASLRYRGRGWPGNFTVRSAEGVEASVTYDESWGRALGPTVQWRCKLCPDGVGEQADVVAGDYWEADERGYPIFEDGAGRSVLIARSQRGLELVLAAFADGVIEGREIAIERLIPVQPLQVDRRTVLAGRLVGARLAGRRVPRYPGFALWKFALRNAVRNARAAKGTFTRSRKRSL